MKNFLFKELRLAAHPSLFIFTALGVLVLVPDYPYGAIFLFGSLATYITFQYGRETNDIYYSSLLPTDRRDIVKSKLLLSIFAECAQLLISLPFAFVRPLLFPGGNVVGIEANVAFYGFALFSYAIYNLIFFSEFYKTAYKAGISFIKAFIPEAIVIGVMETFAHMPSLAWIDGMAGDDLLLQLPILAGGIVAYCVCNIAALKTAVKRFASVDI